MGSQAETVVIASFDARPSRIVVESLLEELGLPTGANPRCRWHDERLFTARVEGPVSGASLAILEALPAVRRVTTLAEGLRLTSRSGERRPVTLPNGVAIGAGASAMIAGPCSVEGEAQICEIAQMVREAGACALRGGVYKPRTSPYAFGGLGDEGLGFLARARELTGLPIVTEALQCSQIDRVAEFADVIQIGSRNMSNTPLLLKAGSHPAGKPVLLKRGFAATIDEFLWAAEYILLGRALAGISEPGVILCERGIRSHDRSLRFTLDVGAIPVLQERTQLPVIADPSHAAGARRFVSPLALAAMAAGADGLIVEAHTSPDEAWCDGDQSLDPRALGELIQKVKRGDLISAA